MVTRTYTAACFGLDVYPIEVEVDGKQGIPQLIFIGLASRAVEEAKERITSALHNCQIRIRSKRTIVNLAPASVPKSGTAFDLAIAVGLLKMYGELKLKTEKIIFLGELALDGQVKPVIGALPVVLGAIKLGYTTFVLPEGNAAEVSTLSGVEVHTIHHLNQLLAFCDSKTLMLPKLQRQTFSPPSENPQASNFFSLVGQEKAKRAIILSTIGRHNLLLIGPPGTGKTQLAKSLRELLPPLSEEESIDTTAIHSLAGLTPEGLITRRPFRAPHHSISRTALIGGGNPLKPGELSLAHHGVLFLDELLEFPTHLLDMLRQPLEDREICLSFSTNKTKFPAHVSLVAACNPCPCGYYGSTQKACSCSPGTIERYRQKLSGSLLDRFDLVVYLESARQLFSDWNFDQTKEAVGKMRELRETITTAQKFPAHTHHSLANLSPKAKKLLNTKSLLRNISGRRYWSIVRVAQTIANLDGLKQINENHIEEALSFQAE